MTGHAATQHDPAIHAMDDGVDGPRNMLFGVRLGIASEVMLFGALFAAYFVIRADSGGWPPESFGGERPEILLPGINTLLLVTSSITMQLGVWDVQRHGGRHLLRWLVITVLLGVTFLGIQGYEYANNGFGLRDGVFGSVFYTLTGFHGFHVLAGLAFIAIVANRARRGMVTAQHHTAVEAASYYWHFVDVVWLFLFSTLYVL
ncbi:MAG TPA: cytochrome c oxidase subunit 3 [Candidatus Limnocylindria bacterium]|jgi:cytochrome c oxidase subunit 3|nr:cytochrome c oxidase subunit 3 [Candidatus Limnocylindria bacterium]